MSDELALPPAEFEEALKKLEELFRSAGEAMREAAGLLARMSRLQLRRIKERFKGLCSADYIERLMLYGRGLMPAHYALPLQSSIRAAVWKTLPKSAKVFLTDEKASVEVMTRRGVMVKPAVKLTRMEMQLVLDEERGILPAPEQQEKFLRPAKSAEQIVRMGNSFIFDGLRRAEDGQVMIYGRAADSDAGGKDVAITVPLKTLQMLIR